MGVTVFYRGSIAELSRIEDLEDRVLDLALDAGGAAQVWRSAADENPERMVRGLIVDLVPGQESTSLLFSPEGALLSLFQIEDAEKGSIDEASWCFVKTQFGSVEGHVLLVEMLDALKKEFIPNLEVQDEGGYWESRDVSALQKKFERLRAAIEQMADGLARHGLSREAAEDPNILVTRVERIAGQVHRALSLPAEHPPVRFEDDPLGLSDGLDEAHWDALFKENRRKQERIQRAIEERLGRGEDLDGVFENALRDEGIIDLPGEEPINEEIQELLEEIQEEAEDEPWRESLRDDEACANDDVVDPEGFLERRHPLQKEAMDLMMRLHELTDDSQHAYAGHLPILHRGAGEMMGGLAQALGSGGFSDKGLCVVQLKRALRGAAFAGGALFPLRAGGVLDQATFDELRDAIKRLESGIHDELTRLRTNGSDG